ncbi:MAG: TetR/AcrR family transcriptional regulator [Aquabacterium sp.]
MPGQASPRRRASEPAARLTRDDWLDAGFRAVVEGGFDQVRVLTLAKALGVTRGSFYWHFGEQADLVQALVRRWQERQQAADRAFRAQQGQDPRADIERLLDTALAHAGTDLEHMRFELALRGLGRRDRAVGRALREVDGMRLALFSHAFGRLTDQPQVAADLAALFYLAVVGSHQALARPGNPAGLKDHLRRLISQYLVQPHGPARPARSARRVGR